MAVETRRYRVDDLAAARNPDTEVLAAQTIRMSLDGTMIEIDLSAENAVKLRKKLAPYFGAGRKVNGKPRSRPTSARVHSAEVRAWARQEGLPVSERGRIPGDVIARYERAQAA